jgi:hypothetical protein
VLVGGTGDKRGGQKGGLYRLVRRGAMLQAGFNTIFFQTLILLCSPDDVELKDRIAEGATHQGAKLHTLADKGFPARQAHIRSSLSIDMDCAYRHIKASVPSGGSILIGYAME